MVIPGGKELLESRYQECNAADLQVEFGLIFLGVIVKISISDNISV